MRERLKGERAIGAGGIRTKDDAMTLGEAGADYLLFGEPRPDGSLPAFETVVERAAWWAEIFETPCVAYAPSLDAVRPLAATRPSSSRSATRSGPSGGAGRPRPSAPRSERSWTGRRPR